MIRNFGEPEIIVCMQTRSSAAHVEVNPDPSEVLREDMVLILVGSNKALEAL